MRTYPANPEDWAKMPIIITASELLVGGWQVMQQWELPLMEAMAAEVTVNRGDILEVGFGLGMAAGSIMKRGCRTYTVIEAHPAVAESARAWGKHQETPVTVLEGLWENIVPDMQDLYDGILFDTFPLSETDRHRNHFPFVPVAARLLRPQGIFTCYSDETINFRPEDLTLLLTYFDEVKLVKVTGLKPPHDCEYWQESYMVIPVAKNRR